MRKGVVKEVKRERMTSVIPKECYISHWQIDPDTNALMYTDTDTLMRYAEGRLR